MKKLFTSTLLLLNALSFSAVADSLSPEGLWKTIDDETGKAKSIVQIWIENDTLNGKIVELLEPEEADPKCTKCEGDKKDQPITGMQFIWGLTLDGDVWDNGEILDPASGSVYSSKIEVIEDGAKLDVRGYIGFAFAGRSQVWERHVQAVETPAVSEVTQTSAEQITDTQAAM